MRLVKYMRNAQQGHAVMQDAWQWAKPHLVAGADLELHVRRSTRSTKQNAMLHALLTDISKQMEWAGKKRDVECWKRLLTAAWLRARGEPLEMLPAVDGHGADIVFRRTSELTKAECAELCDYIMAWAIDNGVVLYDAREWMPQKELPEHQEEHLTIDAETGEILA